MFNLRNLQVCLNTHNTTPRHPPRTPTNDVILLLDLQWFEPFKVNDQNNRAQK